MSFEPSTAFAESLNAPNLDRYKIAPESMSTIVIFGATGDLAGRKLMPAVYNLWRAGFLPENLTIVGVARRPKSDAEFREDMCDALMQHSRKVDGQKAACDRIVQHVFYHQLNFAEDEDFGSLRTRLEELEHERGLAGERLYYLSVGPEFFAPIAERLGQAGLIDGPEAGRQSRIVIEKPFGHDLQSSRSLNASLGNVLTEQQIFRIDHYLGKETVQNINAFRFGNAIFEPLFNRRYVDHVQITVSETVGMEGRRGAFYDKVGALKDVVQNHALQLLCLVAMEPPAAFRAKELRDEKVKVLTSLELPEADDVATWCVRGQYAEGNGQPGFLSEEGVAPDSHTESYIALRLQVNNWRWAGVPFLVRTGKRLKSRLTEIAVQFKAPPTHFFSEMGLPAPETNNLVFRIQPAEAILLRFNAKAPGMAFGLSPMQMDFSYEKFQSDMPEAYERLILDALRGDSTLFTRADEIDAAWAICDKIQEHWDGGHPPELYRPGSWGPSAADRLFLNCEGCWRTPEV